MVSNENFKGKYWAGAGIKKPHPKVGFEKPLLLGRMLFSARPFGRLDRIDFGLLLGGIGLDVGRQVADPVSPFQRRFRRGTTVGRGVVRHHAVAAAALLNDRMATSVAKPATLFFHESTLVAFSNGCANH